MFFKYSRTGVTYRLTYEKSTVGWWCVINTSQSRVHLVAFILQTINCLPTMADFRDQLPKKYKDVDFTNAIALLVLMQQIQEQEPLSDSDVVVVDRDGKWLY